MGWVLAAFGLHQLTLLCSYSDECIAECQLQNNGTPKMVYECVWVWALIWWRWHMAMPYFTSRKKNHTEYENIKIKNRFTTLILFRQLATFKYQYSSFFPSRPYQICKFLTFFRLIFLSLLMWKQNAVIELDNLSKLQRKHFAMYGGLDLNLNKLSRFNEICKHIGQIIYLLLISIRKRKTYRKHACTRNNVVFFYEGMRIKCYAEWDWSNAQEQNINNNNSNNNNKHTLKGKYERWYLYAVSEKFYTHIRIK